MKIKFENLSNRVKPQPPSGNQQNFRKPKSLEKIYQSPKTFLKESMEVIEIAVQDQLETLFKDYSEWRRGKRKRPEYIFNMTQDIAFVSILPKIVKKNYDFILENGEAFSEIISSAVSELTRRKLAKSREMIAIYSNIYEDLNEKRIKRVMKLELKGIEWDDALKLCIVSHGSPRHTVTNTLRTIYSSVKFRDYNSFYKLLTKLYSKEEMPKVAVYILLEKKPDFRKVTWINSEVYSVLTNLALDELNIQSKSKLTDLLKLYCEERRKSEFEQFTMRRVNFSSINHEDYEKIHKVIKKLAKKNDMYKTFLDQTRVK